MIKDVQNVYRKIEMSVTTARRRAMMRAGRRGLRAAQNIIIKRFNLKLSDLNDRRLIKLWLKNPDTLVLEMGKTGLSAGLFKPVQTFKGGERKRYTAGGRKKRTIKESGVSKKNQGGAAGVTVEYLRGRRESVKNPGGTATPFIAQMKSGHIGVFYRIGKERLKIKEYTIGSVAGLLESEYSVNVIRSEFMLHYENEIARQLKLMGKS